MDINSLINTQNQLAPGRLIENVLNLKVGQQLDAKVVSADIQAAKNAITLTLGNKDITVQSNQPITLNSGQDLKIQVTQIAPSVEFKIIGPLPDSKIEAVELLLKLISTARDGGSAASGREPMWPTARDGGSAIGKEPMRSTATDSAATGREPMRPAVDSSASSLSANPLLNAKITGIAGSKIQLQVFTDPPAQSTAAASNKQVAAITIERAQLSNAPADLKVGQNLNLEIIKTGAAPEFKIIPAAYNIPEAKIAEFIKQFLPRHEASPIFLNQLIKDLPQLMKNESVPQALKNIAEKIIMNLPPKEQLISSRGLKQSIADSGLFLEAKLPPAMAQAELIKELPLLIKNESVPQSLQRMAAEILQNLTQKQAPPGSPNLESAVDLIVGKNTPSIGELEQRLEQLLKTSKTGVSGTQTDDMNVASKILPGAVAEDFKANLLKFIQALKQELSSQGEQRATQIDADLLKGLQNKAENTVAKIVMDQLMSLPKEDSPKQLWVIDIPFINRQQAESVRIEVQRDKENKQQSDRNDWSVNITITPPELGTIHCIVSYRNNVISTYFKSQSSQTTKLIKYNLDYLKKQLEASGLTTGHMDAHNDTQKSPPVHQLAGKKLFDDSA